MKKPLSFTLALLFVAIISPVSGFSQISEKSLPPTVEKQIVNNNYPVLRVNPPEVDRLLREDAFTDKYGIAMRFAESTPVDIEFPESGTWMELPDGSRICRLAISSKGAQALILYYNEFYIPEGGKLYLYDPEKRQIAGAFTSFNNRNRGTFATQMIHGETTIMEYHQPSGSSPEPEITINEVSHVYRTAERIFGTKGFGSSDTCEVNVRCAEGNDWENQINGIARIIVKQGSSSLWCTGSLVNNTRQDHTPYFLTADHCGPNASVEDYDSWIFYFKYQGDECGNPDNDTAFNFYTMVGASKMAAAGGPGVESDFKLLLLNESVPLDYDPYFNGWSKIDEPSETGVTIHHPQGDIKKISTYTQTLISTNWGSVPNTHWRVVWSETETNWGVTEGGSSGSPIFNSGGLIIGQLTGGDASCSNLTGPDYYGKFSHSWDQIGNSDTTQLKPWLDPDNTGVETIIGLVNVEDRQKKHFDVDLYPNPTNGKIRIDPGQIKFNNGSLIEISDMTGRKVLEMKPASGQIIEMDLSGLENGIYFVRIIIDAQNILTKKLIK